MDWARNNVGLSDSDLRDVFRYEPKRTTVIKMVESRGYQAQIWTLESHDEWMDWIEKEIQSMHSCERGFVLVLAKRTGEHTMEVSGSVSIDSWLNSAESQTPRLHKNQRAYTFSAFDEKKEIEEGGGRDVRTLPFSLETFKVLSSNFCTHGTIARVVSRADIPIFSAESVVMSEPAYVYNCRTSHAWPKDLALSSTYLPGSGVNFSILYGCPFSIEVSIIRRLQNVTSEAAHPLLFPGIFTELELRRHKKLVEKMVNQVEAKIYALDFEYANLGKSKEEVDERNEAKRSIWLDLSYLRNSLISWNTQIGRMCEHADELKKEVFCIDEAGSSGPSVDDCVAGASEDQIDQKAWARATPESHTLDMQKVGDKIKSRLVAIRDEYDEKIRDCTMRVDGMAMATQWSHGETNVEIALATNQDSKVMRSIALVTMVFLPGTFFATVFSMTFFDWFTDDGKARVSHYLWVYFLITVVFTCVTVGSWYFFVVHRRKRGSGEEGFEV
ncbi:hypothetical protein K458DRAFT_484890 [Lentithecium fluviatile CBS 122367]|uniref:Uncharacterized protein n=1 Tax=Lentithecium fluviatile CBS 122367 TaxID=1168545 RepID=A0A6G1JB35_9PLEO|nr:hypothetical protein K458DRAFT_484890 [Lentithecium fluviatile CBS 122367]